MSRVWSTFESKLSAQSFRIQDVPNDRLSDVADLFHDYFAKKEPIHKAAGIDESEESIAECREYAKAMITHDKTIGITICCLNIEPNIVGDIIGASVVKIVTQDTVEDTVMQVHTDAMKKLYEAFGALFGTYDVMKQMRLDRFLDGRGVVVHPQFCGHGIAQEFFNVRRKMCKDKSVPMTGAWMTSYGSQKAAEQDGWETVFEYPYGELHKKVSLRFDRVPPCIKFMVAKI